MPDIISVKENRIFQRAYKYGKCAATRSVVVYAFRLGKRDGGNGAIKQAPCMLGLTAGKKIGGAVERNRAKRFMREAFRTMPHRVTDGYAIIMVARGALTGEIKPETKKPGKGNPPGRPEKLTVPDGGKKIGMRGVQKDLIYALRKLGVLEA